MIKWIPVFGSLSKSTQSFIIAFIVFWCQCGFSGLKLLIYFTSPWTQGMEFFVTHVCTCSSILVFLGWVNIEVLRLETGLSSWSARGGFFLDWTFARVEYKSIWPLHFNAFKGMDFTNILRMCSLSFEKSAKNPWTALPWEKPASHRIRLWNVIYIQLQWPFYYTAFRLGGKQNRTLES